MKPYYERLSVVVRAPSDLANMNVKLMYGDATKTEAEKFINQRANSWAGVEGQFRGGLVRVGEVYKPGDKHAFHDDEGPIAVEGVLGALEVIRIGTPKFDGSLFERDAIAARLTSARAEKITEISDISFACFALISTGFSRFDMNRTEFERVTR